MNLWMFPQWFQQGFYNRIATQMCETGRYTAIGRFDAPCGSEPFPVILRMTSIIFNCAGAWVGRSDRFDRVWEELGHYLVYGMGINNASPGPTSTDAARSNLSLAALDIAYALFDRRTSTCSAVAGRCPGFLDVGGTNYDSTGREHSFLYAVDYYLTDGDLFRVYAAADLAAGDSLLRDKYEWIRWNIFRGIEFRGLLEPLQQL
jgi:hypothetical protein